MKSIVVLSILGLTLIGVYSVSFIPEAKTSLNLDFEVRSEVDISDVRGYLECSVIDGTGDRVNKIFPLQTSWSVPFDENQLSVQVEPLNQVQLNWNFLQDCQYGLEFLIESIDSTRTAQLPLFPNIDGIESVNVMNWSDDYLVDLLTQKKSVEVACDDFECWAKLLPGAFVQN